MDPTTTVCYHLHPLEKSFNPQKKWRRTFAEHCKKAYVLGTLYDYYRCWNLLVDKKYAPSVSETLFFKHNYITHPTITTKYEVITAAAKLVYAIKDKIPQHLK